MSKFICVSARALAEGDFENRIRQVVKEGAGGLPAPDAVILREKDLSEADYEELAARILPICAAAGTPLILHFYPDAAARLGVRRIHLPLWKLRELPADRKASFDRIGTSCHSPEDVAEAIRLGASYAVCGHVFVTDCKKGLEPRGLEFLRACASTAAACKPSGFPVYAIGGIGPDNWRECVEAGAAGVCVMSGYMTK